MITKHSMEQGVVTLRTPYALHEHYQQEQARTRHKSLVAAIVAGIGLVLLLALTTTGCSTTQPQAFGPAALQASVTLGVQFGLEAHPEATPYVRAAATTVCSVAGGTNIAPAEIVAALAAANVTNNYARLIVNGALAGYNLAFSYYGTNFTQFKPYADALCNGLTLGLPPTGPNGALLMRKELPPHLK